MKLKKVLISFEENSIAGLLLIATIVLFMNVVLRYFFKMSTIWAEEFIRYSMIWISFLGSAICFRKGIHFGVDLILRVKSKPFVRCVKIFIELCCLAFVCFLFKYSLDLVIFSRGSGQISAAMRIPLWIVYSVIPISSLLAMLYQIARIFELLTGKEPPTGMGPQKDEEVAAE